MDNSNDNIAVNCLSNVLEKDGVDLNKFYISTYDNEVSGDGWF